MRITWVRNVQHRHRVDDNCAFCGISVRFGTVIAQNRDNVTVWQQAKNRETFTLARRKMAPDRMGPLLKERWSELRIFGS